MQRFALSTRQPLGLAKVVYFFYFAALAGTMPFLSLYYREKGLSGQEIGLLLGIQPLVNLVSAPIWSAVADVTRQHKRLMMLAIGGVGLSTLGLVWAGGFLSFLPLVCATALFGAPIVPLIDNTVLELLGERRQDYGKQRLWGTVGWGASTLVVGIIIDRAGLVWGFYSAAVLYLGLLAIAARLPVSSGDVAVRFWRGLRLLVAGRPWIIFMLAFLIENMCAAAINAFSFLHLVENLHADEWLIGVASTVGTISEVPVFFFAARMLERWEPRRILGISLVAYAVRSIAVAWLPVPELILPIQLLHGISFGAMWISAVAYARSIAPEGLGATTQGSLIAVMSTGGAIGNVLAGHLYQTIGAPLMYHWAALGLLLAFLLFAVAGRRASRA